ncbi:MAG TPA: hypothetical protein VM142_10745 [Acidimicrobiales bacterium]|nr:hypothetical protein [Acidimicrobiales bacterium]
MTAGDSSCACTVCGVVCAGRFSACGAVWDRGPREFTIAGPIVILRPTVVPPVDLNGAGASPPAPTEPAAVADHGEHGRGEDGRGEVLEWLQSAFEGVRSDLAQVMDLVGRQQQAVAMTHEADDATAHLVELAESLPDRVSAAVADAIAAAPVSAPRQPLAPGDTTARDVGEELRLVLPGFIDEAVREIVRPGQGAMMNRVDEVAAGLRESLVEVQASAAELRNEMARLAGFRAALVADQPELAHAVEVATQRADGRLTALAQRMESIGERPEWKSVRARLSFRRD